MKKNYGSVSRQSRDILLPAVCMIANCLLLRTKLTRLRYIGAVPILFLLFVIGPTANCFAQTSIPGGNVYGTWTLAGSPYLIQGAIQIPNDSTLTIQPGVTVDFQGHYKFLVMGRLLSIGTVTDTITFTASNTSIGWFGIRLNNTTTNNDTSKFYYCKLQYGKANGASPDDNGGGFYFNNYSKVIISNCRIVNCTANSGGGGIYCNGSSPIISNDNISNNTVPSGGGAGIWCENNSMPTITNNIIYNNSAADEGGGILCITGSSPPITYNNISYNTASGQGGGIYCEDNNSIISNNIISNNTGLSGGGIIFSGSVTTCNLLNNIINNNTASAEGGGICCNCGGNSSPVIINNSISNNTAPFGGGISCNGCNGSSSPPVVINNSISNNTATDGGGIYCDNADPIFTNNTNVNNSATNGGALYCRSDANPVFRNTILWGNTAAGSGAQVFLYAESSDPNFHYCDVEGGPAAFGLNGNFYTGTYSNNINSNPLFVSPSGGAGTGFDGVGADWSLQNSSPCIDTGDPATTTPATDKAGNPRVVVCRIDMGAYEYQSGVPFLLSIVQTATIPCNGYSTGALQANISGGTTPYTYSWSSGSTTSIATGLSAGTYTVNVNDASGGCARTATFTITQPAGMNLTTNKTNIDCSGNCIGSATVTATGGTAPYTYLWSSGETTSATNNNLCSGTYSVTVTDAGGCTMSASVTITTPTALSFSSTQVNVSCFGGNNGSITVNATGGTPTYQYSKDGGTNYQLSNIFSGLTAGTYSVVVQDNAGCITSVTIVTITEPLVLSLSTSQTTADCYGGSNATATAIVSGGTTPYTYLWSTSPSQSTATATGLTPGNYSVSVTDSSGCTSSASVTIVSSITNPVTCQVTVDSLSQYNVIIWDKPVTLAIDTFIIYRDTANNNFAPIGKVPYDSLSQFIDTVQALYAANGDPNASTWKYKIAVMDTCGNISPISAYHKTLFIQNNSGNFTWNDYLIEGQPVPVPALSNYLFQRDDFSLGNYVTIQTLSASSLAYTDPQYATYQATATWRVRTLWNISCEPTIANPNGEKGPNPVPTATINTTKSNTFKTGTTGVNETSLENLVSVFPNPTSGEFTIQLVRQQDGLSQSGATGNWQSASSQKQEAGIEVYNIYGEKMYSSIINPSSDGSIINLAQPSGMYFLKIISAQGTANKKIIIQK